MKNYYSVLQVDPKADKEIIEVVYKKLAFRYHPDRNKTSSALVKMQDINEAYGVLRDPASRRNFDATFSPTNTYSRFQSQDVYAETQRLQNELFYAKKQISEEKDKCMRLESRLGEVTTKLQIEEARRYQLEQRTQLAEYARLAFEKSISIRKTRTSLQKQIQKTDGVKLFVFVLTYLLIMPLEIFVDIALDLGTSWQIVGITSMLLFIPLVPAYGLGAVTSMLYKKYLIGKLKRTT